MNRSLPNKHSEDIKHFIKTMLTVQVLTARQLNSTAVAERPLSSRCVQRSHGFTAFVELCL
jgi:hypothetical protein